jgi:phage-related protein
MSDEKPIQWIGSSYRDLCDFPREARRQAGHQLGLLQQGFVPDDFKPFEEIGPGTYEIRIRTEEGGSLQHRVFYVAKFPEAVYVLHAFRKTTRATSQHDQQLGRARYKEMMQDRGELLKRQRRS